DGGQDLGHVALFDVMGVAAETARLVATDGRSMQQPRRAGTITALAGIGSLRGAVARPPRWAAGRQRPTRPLRSVFIVGRRPGGDRSAVRESFRIDAAPAGPWLIKRDVCVASIRARMLDQTGR